MSPGRTNQKLRTRNALLAAARELMAKGGLPSITQVAEAALVSPATAYRYFPDQLSLLRAGMRDAAPDTGRLFAPAVDLAASPGDRIADVVRKMMRLVLDRESLVRGVMALSVIESLEAGDSPEKRREAASLRPGYRRAWIDAALRPERAEMSSGDHRRLELALAALIGPEALVALQDVSGASSDEAVEVCVWAARTLVESVLARPRDKKKQKKR